MLIVSVATTTLWIFSHGHLKYGPPGGITRTCGKSYRSRSSPFSDSETGSDNVLAPSIRSARPNEVFTARSLGPTV